MSYIYKNNPFNFLGSLQKKKGCSKRSGFFFICCNRMMSDVRIVIEHKQEIKIKNFVKLIFLMLLCIANGGCSSAG